MSAPQLLFRAMNENDLSQVCTLEQEASPHPWKAAHFIDSLNSGHQCIVAELDGNIIGYGILMLIVDEAHLLILTIARTHQGKGLGQQILQHLTGIASEHQCVTLLLEVRESNTRAFNLYLNAGFSEIGQRRNYYADTGEDAIVMAMDLQYY